MRENRLSGSEGGGDESNRLSLPLCAPVSVQRSGRCKSFPKSALSDLETNGNCVAARRGGEQPEVADWSVG